MTYVVYECQICKIEVSAPATPEQTLDLGVNERTVYCPKCKTPTILEIACQIKGKKKKGRQRKKSPAAPSDLPQTSDGETLG